MENKQSPASTSSPAGAPAKEELTVTVIAVDTNGESFQQAARAQKLTQESVLLAGIRHPVQPGREIEVRFKDEGRELQGRVAWTREMDRPGTFQVGVSVLQPSASPWRPSGNSQFEGPQPVAIPKERRRNTRYKLALGVEVYEPTSKARVQLSTADVSASGCYMETMFPSPVGTSLHLTLWVRAEKLETEAIVRTCDSGVGMGVEFIGLVPTVRQRLEGFLRAQFL
jgi:hypothetical protein